MTDSDVSEDVPAKERIEESLILRFAEGIVPQEVPCIFILGSPRTGSTLFFQAIINHFRFHYPTNLLNQSFAETPVGGTFFERQLGFDDSVPYESSYGKTEGPFGPSEASLLFKHWFGGEHPSETCSCDPLPGMTDTVSKTFAALHGMSGCPLLYKNAWNCFRVASLAALFPKAGFVWVRRDIAQAAHSDLAARIHRGGPDVWNSATPANHLEIRGKPHWEQVVEQQYEYGRRITADFASFCPERSMQIWYEDLCSDPQQTLGRLETFFRDLGMGELRRESKIPFSPLRLERDLSSDEEGRRILSYVESQREGRLASFCHLGQTPSP
jgi:hypothetical protein